MSSDSLPKTMNALLIKEQGGPEVIQLAEVPVPTINENEVLIKVAVAGINYIDTYFRGGLYPVTLPFTLGQEAAGVVVAVHPSVGDRCKLGSRVAVYTGGSYAEYVKTSVSKLAYIPDDMTDEDAAAVLTQGLTALTMLRESYAVQSGDTIVVHAAAGGVGINLCQIASHLGVRVIGTTSTADKAELAKKNGAYEVVVGGSADELKDTVLRLTDNNGVQAVFDGVGRATWEGNFALLARKATIVTFGNASGAPPEFSPLKLVKGNWKVTRPTLGNFIVEESEFQGYVKELFDLVKTGAVKPLISYTAPFTADGLREAHAKLTGRQTVGKLLVKVA